MDEIDYLIERVAERIAALGVTERQASIDATGTPDALRYIRTRRAMPSPPRLRAIAYRLQATEDYLLGRVQENRATPKPLPAKMLLEDSGEVVAQLTKEIDDWFAKNERLRERLIELPDDIEVYETRTEWEAIQGETPEDISMVEIVRIQWGLPIANFKRQPALFRSNHVYAIYMPSVTMEPVIGSGTPVLANAKRPAKPGDLVLVQMARDDSERSEIYVRFLIGRLVSQNASTIRIEEFNPARKFFVDRRTVESVHRIYTLADFL